ncbi:MAG: hypothetical protein KBB83_04280, partial [Alphaproteobacteria bacterium]|nr:hypothetical protein [Alphaproteobacteria bacterium]
YFMIRRYTFFLLFFMHSTSYASVGAWDRQETLKLMLRPLQHQGIDPKAVKFITGSLHHTSNDTLRQIQPDWQNIFHNKHQFLPVQSVYLAEQYMRWDVTERSVRLNSFFAFDQIMQEQSVLYAKLRYTTTTAGHSPFFKKVLSLSPAQMIVTTELFPAKLESKHPIDKRLSPAKMHCLNRLAAQAFPENASALLIFISRISPYLCFSQDIEITHLSSLFDAADEMSCHKILEIDPSRAHLPQSFTSNMSLYHYLQVSMILQQDQLDKLFRILANKVNWSDVYQCLRDVQNDVVADQRQTAIELLVNLALKLNAWPHKRKDRSPTNNFFMALEMISQLDPLPHETQWSDIFSVVDFIAKDCPAIKDLDSEEQKTYLKNVMFLIHCHFLEPHTIYNSNMGYIQAISLADKQVLFKDLVHLNPATRTPYVYLLAKTQDLASTRSITRILSELHINPDDLYLSADSLDRISLPNLCRIWEGLKETKSRSVDYRLLDVERFLGTMSTLPHGHIDSCVAPIAELYTRQRAPWYLVWAFSFQEVSHIDEPRQAAVIHAYLQAIHKSAHKLTANPRDLTALFQLIDFFPENNRVKLTKRILRKHTAFTEIYKAVQFLPADKIYKVILQAKNPSDIYSEIFAPESLYGQIHYNEMEDYINALLRRLDTDPKAKEDWDNFVARESLRTEPNKGIAYLKERMQNPNKNRRHATNWAYFNGNDSSEE